MKLDLALFSGPIRTCVASLFVLALSGADAPSSPAGTAPVKLPAAKDVIARHIEAVGGRAAILKHTAVEVKGKFEIPAQAISGELEVRRAKPNKSLVKVNIGTFGQVVVGFDGNVGWLILPGSGPVLMQGRMLDQTRDDAEFYNQLHDENNYLTMETVAKTEFAGQECYQLKLVWKSGREVTEFFSVKTGLQAGIKSMDETMQGPVPKTVTLSEYRRFGDLQHPAKMEQKTGDLEQVITVLSITHTPIPDSQFDAPPEVKALLNPTPSGAPVPVPAPGK